MKKTDKNGKNCIMFALVSNVISLLASLFVYVPFFEENDDAFIAMISEGAYGTGEVHLIYTNIILGYIYRVLYSAYPMIRWHSVLQYFFMFTAFTTFTYLVLSVCTKQEVKKSGRVLAIVFLLAVSYESYVSVQYSKTATILATIGYVIIFYTLASCKKIAEEAAAIPEGATVSEKGKRDKVPLIIMDVIAGFLLVYAMLLRDSSFMLASLLAIPAGLFNFINDFKVQKVKALVRYVIAFAPVLVFLLVFTLVNKRAYDVDPNWKSFMEYNDTRMQLLDYRYDLLDYNKHAIRLKGMGISENDTVLYVTWQFGDDDVLTKEKMDEVLKGGPARWTLTDCLKALFSHLYEDVMIFNPLVLGLMVIAIYLLFLLIGSRDAGGLALIMSILVVFSAILVYYEYCGRWSHRIVFAAMLAIAVWLIYLTCIRAGAKTIDGKEVCDITNIIIGAVLIGIACLTVLLGNRLDYNKYRRSGTDYAAMFDTIRNDKDTLYIADTFTFQLAYRYDVLRPRQAGSLDNFAAVGSWFVNSPVTKAITEREGFTNPFNALTGKSAKGRRVVLIDNMYLDEKLTYIGEHYGEASAKLVSDDHGFNCYTINIGSDE